MKIETLMKVDYFQILVVDSSLFETTVLTDYCQMKYIYYENLQSL